MFDQFINRENNILKILNVFTDNNLNFILIGGYAVSAFKHRFSVDADLVIKSEDLRKFEDLLRRNNFKKIISKELDNIYSSKFIRYQKKEELAVSIDLLINGVGIRQTNSAIGFDKLDNNSIKRKIKGMEEEIIAKVPTKELLIALKLQSGRLTDYRDIVALSKDINVDKIKGFLNKCNKKILIEHINQLTDLLDKKEFMGSFKGVFIEKRFDIDIKEIKKLKDSLQ